MFLSKVSRSLTPTPGEIRPIYEAESPDELALVDAAYAYNCKLINRTPNHLTVHLPGEGELELEAQTFILTSHISLFRF